MCVVSTIQMRTLIRKFLSTSLVITVLTHTFCIKRQTCVRTWSYKFLFFVLLVLQVLLTIFNTPFFPSSWQLCTQTFSSCLALTWFFLYWVDIRQNYWITSYTVLDWRHILQIILHLSLWVAWRRSWLISCRGYFRLLTLLYNWKLMTLTPIRWESLNIAEHKNTFIRSLMLC